jgi:phosphorylcholine metabolism protein LicD
MEWNNYKKNDAGCEKYGKQRLELAVYMRDNVFLHLENTWFIENGTLLGAQRNHKFIPHDDDFDTVLLIDNKTEIKNIYVKIKELLPEKYNCRIVNTYCDKIEVYEPSFDKYFLLGPKYNQADYHYVTLDIQFYLKKNENIYDILYYITPNLQNVEKKLILPTTTITLENEEFPAPHLVKEFLENNYGSLDMKAKYCSLSGKYILTN